MPLHPNLKIEPKYLTKKANAQLNPNISKTKKGKKDTVNNTRTMKIYWL